MKRPEETVVVVTGATGRLGQRAVTELLSRGYRVRATDIKAERRLPSETEAEVMGRPNTDYPVAVADMCNSVQALCNMTWYNVT